MHKGQDQVNMVAVYYIRIRYLWANDYKGKGISGRDHYIGLFCSRVMVGTACDT